MKVYYTIDTDTEHVDLSFANNVDARHFLDSETLYTKRLYTIFISCTTDKARQDVLNNRIEHAYQYRNVHFNKISVDLTLKC